MSTAATLSEETLHRRKMLARTWAVLVVVWALIRALIVWAALGDYGINPRVYLGSIILVTFSVAAIGIVRKVRRGRSDRRLAVQEVLAGL